MISNFFEIFILSIIQGVSEFLPISSAAHLIVASNIYEFKNQSLLIDISLHLGSLLAILFYFKEDIFIKAFLFSFPDKTRIALLLKDEIVFNPTVNPNFE